MADAELIIAVDSSPAKTGADAVEASLRRTQTAFANTLAAAQALGSGMGAAMAAMAGPSAKAESSLDSIAKTLGELVSPMAKAAESLGKLSGGMSSVPAANFASGVDRIEAALTKVGTALDQITAKLQRAATAKPISVVPETEEAQLARLNAMIDRSLAKHRELEEEIKALSYHGKPVTPIPLEQALDPRGTIDRAGLRQLNDGSKEDNGALSAEAFDRQTLAIARQQAALDALSAKTRTLSKAEAEASSQYAELERLRLAGQNLPKGEGRLTDAEYDRRASEIAQELARKKAEAEATFTAEMDKQAIAINKNDAALARFDQTLQLVNKEEATAARQHAELNNLYIKQQSLPEANRMSEDDFESRHAAIDEAKRVAVAKRIADAEKAAAKEAGAAWDAVARDRDAEAKMIIADQARQEQEMRRQIDLQKSLATEVERLRVRLGDVSRAEVQAKHDGEMLTEALRSGAIKDEAEYRRLLALVTQTKTAAGSGGSSHSGGSGVNVMAMREQVVMLHELLMGNFSRMPGSMMVLAEHTGNLGSIIGALKSPLGMAAIGTVAFGAAMVDAAIKSEQLQRSLNTIDSSFEATGRASLINRDQLKLMIDQMAKLPGITEEMSSNIVNSLARTASLSKDNIKLIIDNVDKFTAVVGKDAPESIDYLAKAFVKGSEGAKELANNGLLRLTPLLEEQIKRFEDLGDTANAQKTIIMALASQHADAAVKTTELERATKALSVAWTEFLASLANSTVLRTIASALHDMAAGVNDLFNGLEKTRIVNLKERVDKEDADIKDVESTGGRTKGAVLKVLKEQREKDYKELVDAVHAYKDKNQASNRADNFYDASDQRNSNVSTSATQHLQNGNKLDDQLRSIATTSQEIENINSNITKAQSAASEYVKYRNQLLRDGVSIQSEEIAAIDRKIKRENDVVAVLQNKRKNVKPVEYADWEQQYSTDYEDALAKKGKMSAKDKRDFDIAYIKSKIAEANGREDFKDPDTGKLFGSIEDDLNKKLNRAEARSNTVSGAHHGPSAISNDDAELANEIRAADAVGLKKAEIEEAFWAKKLKTAQEGTTEYNQIIQKEAAAHQQVVRIKTDFEKEATNHQLAMAKEAFKGTKERLDAEVEAHQISAQDRMRILTDEDQKEEALELKSLQDELDYLKNTGQQETVEYRRIQDQMDLIRLQHKDSRDAIADQEAKAEQKAAQEQQKFYEETFIAPVGRSFDSLIQQMINGTTTWHKATASVLKSLAASFAETFAKMAASAAGSKLFSSLGWDKMAGMVQSDSGGKLLGMLGLGGGAAKAAEGVTGTANATAQTAVIQANTTAITALNATLTGHSATVTANTGAHATTTGALATNTGANAANTGANAANTGATVGQTGATVGHTVATGANTVSTGANTVATGENTVELMWSGVKNAVGGFFSFLGFASGTSSAPAGPAIVGEEGPELSIGRDGKTAILGAGGPEIRRLRGGETIIPANQTAALMKSILSRPSISASAAMIMQASPAPIDVVGRMSAANLPAFADGVGQYRFSLPESISAAMNGRSSVSQSQLTSVANTNNNHSTVVNYSPTHNISGTRMSQQEAGELLANSQSTLFKIINKGFRDGHIKHPS